MTLVLTELKIESVKQRIEHTVITQSPVGTDDTVFWANTNDSCLLWKREMYFPLIWKKHVWKGLILFSLMHVEYWKDFSYNLWLHNIFYWTTLTCFWIFTQYSAGQCDQKLVSGFLKSLVWVCGLFYCQKYTDYKNKEVFKEIFLKTCLHNSETNLILMHNMLSFMPRFSSIKMAVDQLQFLWFSISTACFVLWENSSSGNVWSNAFGQSSVTFS